MERMERFTFMTLFICGALLCFVPILFESIDHVETLGLSLSLTSNYFLLGLTACLSVSTFVLLEEILGFIFYYSTVSYTHLTLPTIYSV